MNTRKIIASLLALAIVAMTIAGLAFDLVIAETRIVRSTIDEVIYSDSACGFQFLDFTCDMIPSSYEWAVILTGTLCYVQLFLALVYLVMIVVYALINHPFSQRLQMISSISCLAVNFLYMIFGIAFAAVGNANYERENGYYHFSNSTQAYIPFLIVAILFIVYVIFYLKKLNYAPAAAQPVSDMNDGALYRLDGGMVKVLYIYEDHLVLQAKQNLRSWLTQDFFAGTKEIYYSNILGVQYRDAGALIAGFIQFETATSHAKNNFQDENSFTFDAAYVSNGQAREVADFVRSKIREYRKAPNTPTVSQTSFISVTDELKKYKELLDEGVITQEEFDTQKARILQ